jgi:hypothetical protein
VSDMSSAGTYDHSSQKIRDPVRSPLVKLRSGRLVVGSVTTSEYRLLYVLFLPSVDVFGHKLQQRVCKAH